MEPPETPHRATLHWPLRAPTDHRSLEERTASKGIHHHQSPQLQSAAMLVAMRRQSPKTQLRVSEVVQLRGTRVMLPAPSGNMDALEIPVQWP